MTPSAIPTARISNWIKASACHERDDSPARGRRSSSSMGGRRLHLLLKCVCGLTIFQPGDGQARKGGHTGGEATGKARTLAPIPAAPKVPDNSPFLPPLFSAWHLVCPSRPCTSNLQDSSREPRTESMLKRIVRGSHPAPRHIRLRRGQAHRPARREAEAHRGGGHQALRAQGRPLEGLIITIDPGHGGSAHQPGYGSARGVNSRVIEGDLNMLVAGAALPPPAGRRRACIHDPP